MRFSYSRQSLQLRLNVKTHSSILGKGRRSAIRGTTLIGFLKAQLIACIEGIRSGSIPDGSGDRFIHLVLLESFSRWIPFSFSRLMNYWSLSAPCSAFSYYKTLCNGSVQYVKFIFFAILTFLKKLIFCYTDWYIYANR